MTIKELCKKHTSCNVCPYLPICGDMPADYELGDDLEVTNAIVETAKALDQEPIDYKTQYENYLKKSEVVISQLRADRDRLLKAFDSMRAEIADLADSDAYGDIQKAFNNGLWKAVEIIDKCKLESEE